MPFIIGFEVEDIGKLLTALKSNGVKIGEIRQNGGIVEYRDVKEVLGNGFRLL
jgi:hypothetical protein